MLRQRTIGLPPVCDSDSPDQHLGKAANGWYFGGMKKHQNTARPRVGFISLGCPKNTVDSEKMLAIIGEAGFVITHDTANADVVVINTCGFIRTAKDEALDTIGEALELKRRHRVRKVIVAGCLPQRMGKALLDEAPGIDAIVGLEDRDEIAQVITRVLTEGPTIQVDLQQSFTKRADDRGRLLITPPHSAYLRISEGCDRRCSFCTIPAIRGRFRSKDPQLVLEEARELAAHGVVELNVIAQDTNSYGRDLGGQYGLVDLLRDLEQVEGLRWIRLMYLYPAAVDEHLISTLAQSTRIVHYVDMPIQHVNDGILKAMHRSDRREKTAALIEQLRRAMPDVVLRTTVMVGFPGETDADFAELLEFVRWAQFDALGCFTFSAEEGTPAADLPGQVPREVQDARSHELMLAQQEIAFSRARSRVGSELVCLIDETDMGGRSRGRYYGQAPEIDSVCHIRRSHAKAGSFVKVRVTDTQDYDLLAEAIRS